MSVSSADNAMMAKVHALFGKRLSIEDYNQLMQKRTVPEIASYLKNETYFAEALAEVKEDLTHREQLENLLERRTLEVYQKLSKYSYEDKLFFKMYTMKNEIKQLLFAMRLLNAKSMSKFIVSLPVYLAKHMSFDLFSVARARTYDDLLEVLEQCEYYHIVGKFRPATSDRQIDILGCENALLTHYYLKLLDIIKNNYRGSTRENLENLLYYQIDFHNISIIYRMKRHFNGTPQSIAKYLVAAKSRLNARIYEELLSSPDAASISSVLEHRRMSYLYRIDTAVSPEELIFQIQRAQKWFSRRIFRFSIQPVVAVISYMTMLEIEANNVINIIEGIRYNLSADEIKTMLVL